MEDFFKLEEHGTNVKTEVVAGITTFLSMVYILAVNPSILSATGMDPRAIFTATCVASAAGTLMMAFLANYPIALSSGMGLNAYFAFEVCSRLAQQGIQDPYKVALAAVFVEGIIFIILSFFKFRETLVNEVPKNLKLGITVGIGLFITLVGFKGAGIVAANKDTLVSLGSVKSPQLVLAFVGLLFIAVLHHYKVKGSILWGILLTWGLGMIAEKAGWYVVDVQNQVFSLIPDFKHGLVPATPHVAAFDFSFIANNFISFMVVVFSFLFVDLFDTVGTVIGVAHKGNLLDKDGKLPKVGRVLLADALGTCFGAVMGTSTVTSYVESSAGVAQGGRTGLTSVVTALLFIVSLVLSPIFVAIPAFAVAPALIFVGLLMMGAVTHMDLSDDAAGMVSGFLAIVMMPFTYSIANGIMFGLLAFIIIRVFQKKAREIHPVMWVSGALFCLNIVKLIYESK